MNHIKDDFFHQKTHTLLTNEDGQSAVEFILAIGFALGITFLFMTQAFNATKGYIVHYTTYMGSRVYLVNDRGANQVSLSYNEAENVTRDYWESFSLGSLFNLNPTCTFQNYLNANALFTGTVCRFEAETNFFPTIGGGDKAKLVSESFLGKEPVRPTCHEMTCEAITGSRNGCDPKTMDLTLYDNGC